MQIYFGVKRQKFEVLPAQILFLESRDYFAVKLWRGDTSGDLCVESTVNFGCYYGLHHRRHCIRNGCSPPFGQLILNETASELRDNAPFLSQRLSQWTRLTPFVSHKFGNCSQIFNVFASSW